MPTRTLLISAVVVSALLSGCIIGERPTLVDESATYPPTGGVGGSRGGVKCLHAHYADHAAGNENFIGEDTAASVEPLDCLSPCVAATTHGIVGRNPDWREPDREGGSR